MIKHIIPAIILFMAMGACGSGEDKIVAEEPEARAVLDTMRYRQMGDSIVKQTFDTLRTQLSSTIQKEGFEGAIGFCKTNAYAIMDKLASDSVMVRRTAIKFRNPQNAPDSLEAAVLENYSDTAAGANNLQSVVVRVGDTVHYFKPIMLLSLCKNCHGDPVKDLTPAVLAAIHKDYPDDRAVGFAEGDLRGAWHLSFVDREKK